MITTVATEVLPSACKAAKATADKLKQWKIVSSSQSLSYGCVLLNSNATVRFQKRPFFFFSEQI